MQHKDEHIEQQLWDYIDGNCTTAHKQRIATLIQKDAEWGSLYRELLAFQAEISAANELQEPHMRFTQNVMDTISGTQPLPAIRHYINRALMNGIAAFFIIMIVLLLTAILFSTNWNTPATHISQKLPTIDLSSALNSQSIFIAIGIIVVLCLAFLDHVFRTRHLKHR